MALEYVGYELGRPRYTPDECRRLRLTYGAPFKVRVRLEKDDGIEEEVYLGEIPLMLGGGEFIINGAERVIVTQLHRSPGVDFSVDIQAGERKLHSCWIIPERGSWIELNVNKKDALQVRIDQSGKFPCTSLLRAARREVRHRRRSCCAPSTARRPSPRARASSARRSRTSAWSATWSTPRRARCSSRRSGRQRAARRRHRAEQGRVRRGHRGGRRSL
jgi:DNA-directed RNA polymerase beta subunit